MCYETPSFPDQVYGQIYYEKLVCMRGNQDILCGVISMLEYHQRSWQSVI